MSYPYDIEVKLGSEKVISDSVLTCSFNSVQPTPPEPPEPSEYIDIILGFRWETFGGWKVINFDFEPDDNYWWGCLKSRDDISIIQSFGLSRLYSEVNYPWLGPYGGLLWDENYTFEPLAVYSDIGETEVEYDLSTLFIFKKVKGDGEYNVLAIGNSVKNATNLMSWKCRITKKNT